MRGDVGFIVDLRLVDGCWKMDGWMGFDDGCTSVVQWDWKTTILDDCRYQQGDRQLLRMLGFASRKLGLEELVDYSAIISRLN